MLQGAYTEETIGVRHSGTIVPLLAVAAGVLILVGR
jgi:hypothetical protein